MRNFSLTLITLIAWLPAAAEVEPKQVESPRFIIAGTLENPDLDEASGIQAGANGVFYLHNDEKRDVFVINDKGHDLGSFKLDESKNKDWEDITRVPDTDGQLLVVADTGDNSESRKTASLYFFREPEPGTYASRHEAVHRLKLRYPGGPRDVESVAFDPVSEKILLLSKRDNPPRLYGIPLDRALAEKEVEAEFLAEVPVFRPPTATDLLSNPHRGWWVSQPTGMDISPDGRRAAVITYRSLYLFERIGNESWPEAFQRQPTEYLGPPGLHDEGVGFSADGRSVYIVTERRPAPVYRLDLE